MSNEKNTRTVIEDLPATEQELTEKEMENVQGGAGSTAPSSQLTSPSPGVNRTDVAAPTSASGTATPNTKPEAGLSGSVSN